MKRVRRSPLAGTELDLPQELLLDILGIVAQEQGVRIISRVSAVCQFWNRIVAPMASEWDALRYTHSIELEATQPSKPSFVVAIPAGPCGPDLGADQLLGVASMGKDIQCFDPSTGEPHSQLPEIATAAGVWPSGLASDGRHLFVCGMLNCSILKLELPSCEVVEAGGGFGSGGGGLHSPQGLALHGSTLFVADSGNGRIAVWDAAPLRFRRSFGSKGGGQGQLLRPTGLAADAEHVYVADSGNHRLCTFTHDGTFVRAIGEYGAAPGLFRQPRGVALCGADHLLVTEEEGRRSDDGALSTARVGARCEACGPVCGRVQWRRHSLQ